MLKAKSNKILLSKLELGIATDLSVQFYPRPHIDTISLFPIFFIYLIWFDIDTWALSPILFWQYELILKKIILYVI